MIAIINIPLEILLRIYGIKVVGDSKIKDIKIVNSYAVKNQFYANMRFDIENSVGAWIQIFPYKEQALVEPMIKYEIIDVNGIKVRLEKTEYNNIYLWDKGEHSYYMVAESISEKDLYNIINGLSVEISDKNTVKECLKLRGY